MKSALSAPRTRPTAAPYNTSPSLYGGDSLVDDELDSYFSSPTSATRSKKQRKQPPARSKASHKPSTLSFSPAFASALDDDELTADPILGTSQSVEKDYYRLTSAPVPAAVRPLSVLMLALERVKQWWKTKREYGWCCNQLKSIRQDLTVQHIRTTFACECYETHGRIALEEGDLSEFAQLMTPLSSLHAEQLTTLSVRAEFIAYRILLACHHKRHNDLSLLSLLATLPTELSSHPNIAHALDVRQSLLFRSYLRFFALYHAAPAMSPYLMDGLAGEMRMRGLRVLCGAFRGKCECGWVRRWVGFEQEDECAQWLVAMGVEVQEEVAEAKGGEFGDVTRWSFDAKAAQAVVQLYDDRGLRIQDQQ